jgi:uncharacterized protein with HEPN domain
MSRDFKLYLKDISEAAVFIETHTQEITSEQLAADTRPAMIGYYPQHV